MRREEAARFVHRSADFLERHDEVEFLREGLKSSVRVPDEIEVVVEPEIEHDTSSIEIELRW